MKYLSLFCLMLLPSSVFAVEYFEQMETEVYQTTGTVSGIAQKAKSCIAQNSKNAGSDLFLDVNIDSGTITANSRVDYTRIMTGHSAKSTLSFLAKENRFKMRYTNIEIAVADGGYSRLWKGAGSGWKNAEKAILDLSDKIAKCVQAEPKKEEW